MEELKEKIKNLEELALITGFLMESEKLELNTLKSRLELAEQLWSA